MVLVLLTFVLSGEALTAESAILSGLLGNSTIPAGETFAITTASNASSTGSAFSIVNGIYFIRGQCNSIAFDKMRHNSTKFKRI